MQEALACARLDGTKLAVLYLDLDMFKQVNDSHGDDYRQLIRYADEAMYAAKKSGGNRSFVRPVSASNDDAPRVGWVG